jgi:hypothetical protein
MSERKVIDAIDSTAMVDMLVSRWLTWYEQAQSLINDIEHKFSPAAIERHMPDFSQVKESVKKLQTVPEEYAGFLSGKIPQATDEPLTAAEWVKRLNDRFDEAEKELLHYLGSLETLGVSLAADPAARTQQKVLSPRGIIRNFLVPILAALITSPVTTAINNMLRAPAAAFRAAPAEDSFSFGKYIGFVVVFVLVLALIYAIAYGVSKFCRALKERRGK